MEDKARKVQEWGVLPDATVLRRLRNQGMSYKKIGELYNVTESGVWRAFERAGMIKQRPTYRDVVPWKIGREVATTQTMMNLRSMAKRQAGLPIGEQDERILNNWLESMKESNVVLAYHPDAPPNDASSKGGFYYVEREESDGDEWFRA